MTFLAPIAFALICDRGAIGRRFSSIEVSLRPDGSNRFSMSAPPQPCSWSI